MPDSVEDLLKKHSQLASERSSFDSLNQEIAELVLPDHATFTIKDRTQGEKRAQRQFDATAPTEAWRHAAAITSLAAPSGEKWDGISAIDDSLMERDDVQQWTDDVMDAVRTAREAQGADFAAQFFDTVRLGGVFGTASLGAFDNIGGGIRYRCIVTPEIYISVDAFGRVCEMHRRWKMTAYAAWKEYGDLLPQKIRDCLEKEPLRQFEFLHCIYANEARSRDYLDARSMPWVSVEIAIEDKHEIRRGGYMSWPMPVYRYNTSPGEWYGRGWACEVLPEIKLVNRARKALIRQTEKAADPPLLLHDDGMLNYGTPATGQTPSLAAGSLNYNSVTDDGKPKVLPLFTGADLSKADQLIASCQRNIKDAALTSLFQIFQDRERMTATEWLGLMQEKGQLQGPMIGRSVTTFLAQVQEREIEILARQGKLPPMPRVLMQAGGEYKTVFNSPLMRLMKLREVMATQQWLTETILPFVQFDQSLLDLPDWEKISRETSRARGVPADFVVDKDVLEAKRKARAKQAAMQSVVTAAPEMAGAVKDLAQARAIARGA